MAGKAKKSGAAKKPKATRPAAKQKREVAVRDRAAAKKPARVRVKLPAGATAADRREAEQFVLALDLNEQLARKPGPLPPGATHQLEADGSAPPRLVRKRFSAR